MYDLSMTRLRFAFLLVALGLASPATAQVAAVPYWMGTPFGFHGSAAFGNADHQTTFYGTTDDDGFRKGFSFSTYSVPASAFASGFALSGLNAFGGAGLASNGAQYGYSFKGIGDTPVTLFGGVNTLRTTPDVFTSLVTPGFERTNALATSVNAGIEFRPSSNVSLSFSANIVQPSAPADGDLRSQLISGYRR